ncbi:MAG: M15 family metallopeptidase [Pleurocapsa sp.]
MKPYHQIPIEECGEPLVSIPLEKFAVEIPHPYLQLGAEYGERSPYCLRQGVVAALVKAQCLLNRQYPQGKLKIYDAYRPVGVQQFMVNHTFNSLLKKHKLNGSKISPQKRQDLWQQVYQLWAAPSLDLATPPPHSTGGAIDLTIADATGKSLNLGGEIDELSARSHPDYYAKASTSLHQQYHYYRQLLNEVMVEAGFYRHPGEWWHFSLGDQMWAWQHNQINPDNLVTARYGRIL